MHIGIDLMGSDNPPLSLFNAVLQASQNLDSSCSLVVIATKGEIDHLRPLLPSEQNHKAKITFHPVADTIAMAEEPLGAVRRKKGSSLMVGIRLLKKRQLDAFVSCGNTGALVASAALSLPMLPGIRRPALLAQLPTEKGTVSVLDVGGTVTCKANYLVQCAHLGAAYQRAAKNIESPIVGLLNVGSESKKGNSEVRQAYDRLKALTNESHPGMIFAGNVEGRDVFKGHVDVLVTDGFSGNVLVKTAEGAASFIFSALSRIHPSIKSELDSQINDLQKQFNYAEYPGAIICGVEGIVIKAHGSASSKVLYSSIMGAVSFVEKQIISKIKAELTPSISSD